MLCHSRGWALERRRQRNVGGNVGVNGAKERAVGKVHHSANRSPGRPARYGLAEQLGVVVGNAEDSHVNWLLKRPDAGGDRSSQCAA